MLKQLIIKNYALIDSLDLSLGEGLSIITGETGAGKSIMLGAMSLLRGERADSRVVADKESKSIVEALFSGVSDNLKGIFEANDLDWNDGEVIVRREISSSGRGRAFINDVPVTLGLLSNVTTRLLEIHSQHGNAKLLSSESQLEIIDTIGESAALKKDYHDCFTRFVKLRGRIKRYRDEREKARENREFLTFQYEQLDKLRPKRGELQEIERKFEMLSDADELRERLAYAISILGDSDNGALNHISEGCGEIEKLDFKLFSLEEENLPERLNQCRIELKDICGYLEDCLENVSSDPQLMARMSARMNKYYEAMRHFHVGNPEELVDLYEDIKSKLDSLEDEGGELADLEKEGRRLARLLKEKADLLTECRRKGGEVFARMVNEGARPLGLSNLVFEVALTTGKLTSDGQDKVEFMCAFNKRQTPMSLAKAASGGEISRLMLTIEDIIAGKMQLPTVILDEIDTGVSGDIADRMGKMMRKMSGGMQVITITHLPQVAAKGEYHFKVYKKDMDDKTVSFIKPLEGEERVRELAAMMSGSELTEAAIENARVLLGKQ